MGGLWLVAQWVGCDGLVGGLIGWIGKCQIPVVAGKPIGGSLGGL